MKKYLIFSFFIFFAISSFAQTTVSLPEIETYEQTEITVPLTVSNQIDNVGSFTFNITYDTNVLDFAGVYENAPESGNFQLNHANGVISIAWFDVANPISLSNSIIDLTFTYKTGTSQLQFVGINEITDASAAQENIILDDGLVSEIPLTVSLGKKVDELGAIVSVPLTVKNFKNVHSITWYIQYDQDVVTFDSLASDIVGFTYEAVNGVLTLGWYDAANAIDLQAGKLADLVFGINGGATNLVFGANCEITNLTTPLAVVYNDGFVSDYLNQPATISLPDTKGNPESNVIIPISGTGLNNLGSFTLRFDYDPTVLSFVQFNNVVSGSFNANESDGTLTIAYFNTDGLVLGQGDIVDLEFTYSGGNSDLAFDASFVEITDNNDNPLAVTVIDGSINANLAPVIAVPVKDTTISENTALVFSVSAIDHDGDDVTITAANLPDGAVFNNNEFSWTPTYDQAGYYNVVFIATDIYNATDTDSSSITVVNENQPPVFTKVIGIDSTKVDTWVTVDTYTFTYEAIDPDGDDITFSLADDYNGQASISSSGIFTFTPDKDEHDIAPPHPLPYDIIVSVSDGSLSTKDTSLFVVDVITDVPNTDLLPTEYALEQNYPNPFNPTSNIKFSIPVQSNVRISVYNMLGQEVAELVNSQMAVGVHNVKFNAVNLSSGIYFYNIKASALDGSKQFSDVKKMMLMK